MTETSNTTLQPRAIWLHPAHLLSFGFGSGLAPKAPGTFGTAAAVPLYWLLADLPLLWYASVLVLISLVGIWLCGYTAKALGAHDHPAIVWDEFAGYLLTMFAVPFSPRNPCSSP